MHTEIFSRRVYELHGIKVIVEIDFLKHQISLVEAQERHVFKPKRWLFAERELKYMTGWKLILEAMQYAIKESSEALAEVEQKEMEEFAKLLFKTSFRHEK